MFTDYAWIVGTCARGVSVCRWDRRLFPYKAGAGAWYMSRSWIEVETQLERRGTWWLGRATGVSVAMYSANRGGYRSVLNRSAPERLVWDID